MKRQVTTGRLTPIQQPTRGNIGFCEEFRLMAERVTLYSRHAYGEHRHRILPLKVFGKYSPDRRVGGKY